MNPFLKSLSELDQILGCRNYWVGSYGADMQKYNFTNVLSFSSNALIFGGGEGKEVLFTDKVLSHVTVAKLLSAPCFTFLSQEVVYLFLIFPGCSTPLPSPPFFFYSLNWVWYYDSCHFWVWTEIFPYGMSL